MSGDSAADPIDDPPEDDAGGAFAGVKIVSIGGVGPVPFAAMMLADHGADVVLIERPVPEVVDDRVVRGIEIVRRGCTRVRLDLKSADGLAHARAIIDLADVVLDGFRPGVAERLGLGPDEVRATHPGLVFARMTGFGQSGSMVQRAGHDINYLARTGAVHLMGRRGGPPQVPLNLVADYGGGAMFLLFGVATALFERERSGCGQVIDVAMVDGVALLLAPTLERMASGSWHDERGVNPLDTGHPNYDVYETSDDRWMAVGAREPSFHRAFLDALGLTDEPLDPPDGDHAARRGLLSDVFASRTLAEWTETFADIDACVDPVLTVSEASRSEPLVRRGTYIWRDGHVEPGVAPRFSRSIGSVKGNPRPEDARVIVRRWSENRRRAGEQ